MPLSLSNDLKQELSLLRTQPADKVIELCKQAFEYLSYGPNGEKWQAQTETRKYIEALIALLIECSKTNITDADLLQLQTELGVEEETLGILNQFISSKRKLVQGSVKLATLRSYRLVNLEWRVEVRIASRSLLKQCNVCVVMKLFLHTEPKSEHRDILNESNEAQQIHPDERRNRKDILVQTDVSSLVHMIQTLENALLEARSHRIRNIVRAIH